MIRFGFGFTFAGCLLAAIHLPAQEVATTTWFVVRHADRAGGQDELTQAGRERADQLRDLMKSFRVQAVYSTNTNRTKKTAEPTAKTLGVPVTVYEAKPDAEWFAKIKTRHVGAAVLIVGHSNTCGEIVKGLGGQGDFSIAENDFDNLFVVTTNGRATRALRLEFGNVTK